MTIKIAYAQTYFTDTGVNDPSVNTSTYTARNSFEDKSPSTAIRNQAVPFRALATAISLPGATDVLRFISVPKGAQILYLNWWATTGSGSSTARLGWESGAPTIFSGVVDLVTAQAGLLLTPALLVTQTATTAADYLSATLSASSAAIVTVGVMGAWYIP